MFRLPARLSVLAATLFMMPLMARASKAAAATCTKGRPCSAFATSTFGRSPSFFGRAGEGSVGASAARPLITNAFPTLSSHPWYVCMHGLWVWGGWGSDSVAALCQRSIVLFACMHALSSSSVLLPIENVPNYSSPNFSPLTPTQDYHQKH